MCAPEPLKNISTLKRRQSRAAWQPHPNSRTIRDDTSSAVAHCRLVITDASTMLTIPFFMNAFSSNECQMHSQYIRLSHPMRSRITGQTGFLSMAQARKEVMAVSSLLSKQIGDD